MSADELSVLHVLAPAPWGGLETVVRTLAAEQQRAGLRVHVAAVVGEEGGRHPFVVQGRDEGLAVDVVRAPGRRYARERDAVRDLVHRRAASVVHTHGYRADVVDGPAGRDSGTPAVSTVHGFTGNGLRNRFYEWLQRRALRALDAVIAVSRPQVAVLEDAGVNPSRIHLIPNAWRPRSEALPRIRARNVLGLTADARVIGFVGRLSREKDPGTLIQALGHPALREVEVCLVGEGPSRSKLESLAEEAGVGSRVVWAGRMSDADRLMGAFDVLALPSRTEGTPMVLFEATEAGVPVVATAVGGVPDVLGDGPNVVPPGEPAALATALARGLESATWRRAAVRRARARMAEAYAVGPWVERHLDLYRRLSDAPLSLRSPTTGGVR